MAQTKKKRFTTLSYAEALGITPQAVIKKIKNENEKNEIKKLKFSDLTKAQKRKLANDYFVKGVTIERNCREWCIIAPVNKDGSVITQQ